ncbi:MAG: hypothetical protein MZV63_35820 [Marinilabiliales bacterium]|nr:hypothetical protein [Marinilabiliales bacterium]
MQRYSQCDPGRCFGHQWRCHMDNIQATVRSVIHPLSTRSIHSDLPIQGLSRLTLTVTSTECGTSADNVVITFTSAPMADAGPDAATCMNAVGYQVIGASHAGGTVTWSTGGNGTFDNATIDNPYLYIRSGGLCYRFCNPYHGGGRWRNMRHNHIDCSHHHQPITCHTDNLTWKISVVSA